MNNIPYYSGNIYNSFVLGHISIDNWYNAHKHPKSTTLELMANIRNANKAGNIELKQKLKEKLFCITPSVYIEKDYARKYDNIKYFTGYMQIDFDKLHSEADAIELREYMFETYEPIVLSYLSPSRRGVKCILKIKKPENIDEYKDYHKAVEDEFTEVSKSFDHATFNCVLPLFLSVDKDIKYRPMSPEWNIKGDRTVEYVRLNTNESEWAKMQPDFEKSLKTVTLFRDKINEIIDGDGHPRLRSACLVLGSRAGAGYIDQQQAIEVAYYCIESNPYLNKKASTYKKTAYWAINEGANHPQYY